MLLTTLQIKGKKSNQLRLQKAIISSNKSYFILKILNSGYWIGLTIAETIVGIVYVTLIYKTNWKVQIELAQIRAGLVAKPKVESKETTEDEDTEKTSKSYQSTVKERIDFW